MFLVLICRIITLLALLVYFEKLPIEVPETSKNCLEHLVNHYSFVVGKLNELHLLLSRDVGFNAHEMVALV